MDHMTDSLAHPHLRFEPAAGDPDGPSGPRSLVILGSTGSIGTQAIDIVLRNPDRFRVTALSAAGGRVELLADQAHQLRVSTVAVAREDAVPALRTALADRYGAGEALPEILAGPDAATEVAASPATPSSTASPAPSDSPRPWPLSGPAGCSPWPTRSR